MPANRPTSLVLVRTTRHGSREMLFRDQCPLAPCRAEPLEPRRLLSAADLDPSFADAGRVFFDGPDFASAERSTAAAVALQPDGKLLLAGGGGAGSPRGAVARFNPDGSLDTTFDRDGHAAAGFNDFAEAIELAPGGKIVLGGLSRSAFTRLNPDGSPDPTFGTGGTVHLNLFETRLRAMLVQPDDKIVAAGGERDSVLVRLNVDGTLDRTFSDDGIFGGDQSGGTFTNYPDFFASVALRPDGSLLVGGGSRVGRSDARPLMYLFGPDGVPLGGAVFADSFSGAVFNALAPLP